MCSRITQSVLLLATILVAVAQAQTATNNQAPTAKTSIIIERQLVRFITSGEAVEWQLLITNQQAEVIFDSGFVYGTALEWPLKNQQEEAVPSGLYAYTLTSKAATDETPRTQRGHIIVNRPSQSERIWVTSEQSASIGATNTEVKLTVVGGAETTIGGAEFPGSVPRSETGDEQRSAYVASGRSLGSLSERSGLQRDAQGRPVAESGEKLVNNRRLTPAIDGTGTAGRLSKWIGTNGTPTDQLGDSVVFELNGNLGIGTTNPTASFHASRGDGSYQYKMERTGSNARTYGFGADSFGNFFLDDVTSPARRLTLDTAGNLGIGSPAPSASVHASRGDGSYQFKMERTGANARVYGFGADSFGNFFLDDVTSLARRLTINTGGSVGIGTTNPSGKLHVSGGSPNFGSAIFDYPDGAIRILKTAGVFSAEDLTLWNKGGSGGQPFAITGWNNNNGIYINTSNGNVGIDTGASLPQAKLDVRGDATQSRSAGGFAKAMIFVDADGTIVRCYNSQVTGSAMSTPPCGFSINHATDSVYTIDFGFNVRDRFYSVTMGATGGGAHRYVVTDTPTSSLNQLVVGIYNASADYTNSRFTVFIF